MTNRASVPDGPSPASRTPTSPAPATDRARTVDQLSVAIKQLVRVLSNVRNPNAPATNRWTVTDVAAHIAGNLEVCTAMVRGVPSPAGSIDAIGALNDLVIATLGERDIDRLGQHIEAHAAAYIEAIRSLDGDPPVPWHAHLHVPASTLAGLSLGEAIVHGLDIARATDQAWPVRTEWARTVVD
ncbi:MAG TPA: maleylpyruvate isomerase N-terminal domain-containing protein, partial [Micromonosporaceae bacterium]